MRGDPNLSAAKARGRVPLSLALSCGRGDLARLLAQHGADPNALDKAGQTVWEVCAAHRVACRALEHFIAEEVEHRPPAKRRMGGICVGRCGD